MRREVFFLMIAVFVSLAGLKGIVNAADSSIETRAAVSDTNAGIDKDEEAVRTAETRKTEETKRAEEEKKAVEEAKKIIVARVNGEDINMFMLVRAMNKVAPKYIKEGEVTSPEATGKIRQEALERLILEELAVQEAIKQDINPDTAEIEKVMAQVKENLVTEEAYLQYLENSNLTEETLKKLIERSRRYELITAREVYSKIKVDEKLLQAEYEKEKGRFVLPDNFVVEDVFFIKGEDEAAIREKAGEVLETIRKKNNDVWKLVLDGTFIIRKTAVKKEKYPEMYNAVVGMKAGELSGVIKDQDGFHIIKVMVKEPSRQLTFEEARNAIEPRFLVPAQNQRKEEWEKELRENAKIEMMNY